MNKAFRSGKKRRMRIRKNFNFTYTESVSGSLHSFFDRWAEAINREQPGGVSTSPVPDTTMVEIVFK